MDLDLATFISETAPQLGVGVATIYILYKMVNRHQDRLDKITDKFSEQATTFQKTVDTHLERSAQDHAKQTAVLEKIEQSLTRHDIETSQVLSRLPDMMLHLQGSLNSNTKVLGAVFKIQTNLDQNDS